MAGCRCAQCWGLRETMLAITGKTYGLQPAPGHPSPARKVEPERSMTDLDPDEFRRLQELAQKRRETRQPWDVAV